VKDAAMPIQEESPVELNINLEKICFIILKAREFDAELDLDEADPDPDPADDAVRDTLEDLPKDPTVDELSAAIDGLNDDEVIDLIALAWIGRGDFGGKEWREARQLATERHRRHSAAYLMGMPALGDYLEDGLRELSLSCADYDAERL
jgi:hypothetical protein